MPVVAQEELMQKFDEGKAGLETVCDSLGNIDSERAQASVPEDEEKVKSMIGSSKDLFRASTRKSSRSCWIGSASLSRTTSANSLSAKEQGDESWMRSQHTG